MFRRMQQLGAVAAAAVAFAVGCADVQAREERPAVAFVSVEARPTRSHVFGTSLTVEIELETKSAMPHVAPHVIVAARCADASDDAWAFFQSLSNAQAGDRKVDSVELFRASTFDGDPGRCELTLSLSEGATPPQRYCYDHGTTRAGRC